MKKYILMFGLTLVMGLFIANTVSAQWTKTGTTIHPTTLTDRLGVGVNNADANAFGNVFPQANLFRSGAPVDFFMSSTNPGTPGGTIPAIGRFIIKHDLTGDYLQVALLNRNGNREMVQSVYRASDNKFLAYNYLNFTNGKYEMRNGITDIEFLNTGATLLNGTGPVGIGVAIADVAKLSGAKLGVNGKIVSTEVEVKLYGSWPDFVFQDDFNLMPLNELESFIATNRHLPGVPTEADVTENGVNLGQMTGILLQKVEEMTLHIIDLNKRIAELEK